MAVSGAEDDPSFEQAAYYGEQMLPIDSAVRDYKDQRLAAARAAGAEEPVFEVYDSASNTYTEHPMSELELYTTEKSGHFLANHKKGVTVATVAMVLASLATIRIMKRKK